MAQIDISKYKKANKKRDPRQDVVTSFDLIKFLNTDISFGTRQISDKKKEEFYLEFSTLLLSGIDIRTAFDLILVDQKKGKRISIFETIKNDVILGSSLSKAIEDSSKFSTYEVQSIKIGEETGKLAEILRELAIYYKSKIAQRRKIISALTYPIIVMCTSFGAVFFMLKFVVPMFADIFNRFGGELPWITAQILLLSNFIDKTFVYFSIVFIGIVAFLYSKRRTRWFRKWSAYIILRIPVVKDIVRKIHLARFASTMRLLISTNTPLLQSIQLIRQMSDFFPIHESLKSIEESVLHGQSLHASLNKFPFYPKKMIQLVKVGEEVNKLDFFFEKIAQQYTDEVEYQTSTLSTLLEPLIIIFLGLIVGLILIAMYLPMFQMSNSF